MENKRIALIKKYFIGVIPLLLAAIFYFLFCPDVYFVKYICNFLRITSFHNVFDDQWVFVLFRNYLPDFLWAFSLMYFGKCIYASRKKYDLIFGIIIAFQIFLEIMQLTSLITGTFDILDIFVELLADIIVIKIMFKGEMGNEKR